jgi:hypothetical protein
MTTQEESGKKPPAAEPEKSRHPYGPRPLGGILAPLLRPAFKRRGGAGAQLLADWPDIVGPQLAAITTPRALNGTRLTIACAGPVALELQHLATALTGRINAQLGRAAVTELRFVQAAADLPARAATKLPPAPAVARAELAVADLPPGELRDALVRLGAQILARSG